jgi:antitoxin (DNA-binding transcriptional repressor) of toxin-antitoxin stability system
MKTAALRPLRHDFGRVFAWVEQGEPVEISRRGKIIALLAPLPTPKAARPRRRPDFAARLKLMPLENSRMRSMTSEWMSRHSDTPLTCRI